MGVLPVVPFAHRVPMTCSAPFSLAASILAAVAPPHLGSVITGFVDARGEQLASLATIVRVIDPESPMAHIVARLVAQAHSGYKIEPEDLMDAADDAKREIDQLIEAVPEDDWFMPENSVLWRRWDDAHELAKAVRQARCELKL